VPELPEVETVRRGLSPVLERAVLSRVEQRRPDLRFPFSANFVERLTGRRVIALRRRAKYLLAELDDGTVLLMHLGMSGSFRVETSLAEAKSAEDPIGGDTSYYSREKDTLHDHVVLHLLDGTRVVYNDPRRFGFMLLIARDELDTHPLLAELGLEPTGNALSAGALVPRLAGRAAPLKAVLLDQTLIAGLGISMSARRSGAPGCRRAAPPAAWCVSMGGQRSGSCGWSRRCGR
jgi:formamidopyrimidine-DNA glycosylase